MTKKTKEDLEAPLKPGLQYYDATPSIEALAEEVRQLSNRCVQLEKCLATQSSINGQLLDNMNQMRLAFAEARAEEAPSLILPDRLTN